LYGVIEMTYSEDLRKRVVAFVKKGGRKSEACRRFNVSRWCVYNWINRPSLAPQQRGVPRRRLLCLKALEAHVHTYPDAYQYERAEALGVSRHVILYGLRRLGIKKNAFIQRKKRQLSQ
jgi:transposase-like protein